MTFNSDNMISARCDVIPLSNTPVYASNAIVDVAGIFTSKFNNINEP
jgi:hypothetical protein